MTDLCKPLKRSKKGLVCSKFYHAGRLLSLATSFFVYLREAGVIALKRSHQAALDSARYIDDELEGLLNANGGAHFKLDRFLSPPPELAEGWMGDGAATQLSNEGDVSEKVMPARAQVVAAALTVANTTPRQNNTAICQTDDTQEAGHTSSYKGVDSTRSEKQEAGVKTEATGFLEETIGRELVLAPSRDAEVTAGGIRTSGTVKERLVEKDEVRNMSCNGDNGLGQVDVGREAAKNDLIKAWGLKDPKVAGMMMKRMKRLRKFHNSEVTGSLRIIFLGCTS